MAFAKIKRLREMGKIIAKYGLASFFPAPIISVLGINNIDDEGKRLSELNIAEKLRYAFEELGTTYIKLGQLLSIRKDIVPEAIALEFQKLQDQVTPVSFDLMKPIIEGDLAGTIEEIFSSFDETPIAAASISQVYAAVLKDNGASVVVKVRKPDIVEKIKGDMDILFWIADLMQKHSSLRTQVDFKGIAEEFFLSMKDELDLNIEKKNTLKFAENFASKEWEWLVFPKIYENYSSSAVLVMEKINGRKVYELDDTFDCDRKIIAEKGARVFLRQIFENGFFHADMHAGNVFFLEGNRLAIIDCGMTGTLDRYNREMVAELLIAFARRDFTKLAEVYADISDTRDTVDKKLLAKDLKKLVESMPETIGEIRSAEMFNKSFSIFYRHKLKVPRAFTLLIRGISVLEGLGRELEPNFNFIEQSQELSAHIIKTKYSPERMGEELFMMLMRTADFAKNLPDNLSGIIEKIESGNLQHRMEMRFSPKDRQILSRLVTRMSAAFVLTGALMSLGPLADTPYLFTVCLPVASISLISFLATFRKSRDEH